MKNLPQPGLTIGLYLALNLSNLRNVFLSVETTKHVDGEVIRVRFIDWNTSLRVMTLLLTLHTPTSASVLMLFLMNLRGGASGSCHAAPWLWVSTFLYVVICGYGLLLRQLSDLIEWMWSLYLDWRYSKRWRAETLEGTICIPHRSWISVTNCFKPTVS